MAMPLGPQELGGPLDLVGGWRPRVLVAEDDDELRRLIVEALTLDGYVVSEARDSAELIEIATQTKLEDGTAPELVLTDVRMPGCTGIQALALLRAHLKGAAILVITAFSDEETRRAAAQAGASAVLDKPFDVDALRAAVAAVLR